MGISKCHNDNVKQTLFQHSIIFSKDLTFCRNVFFEFASKNSMCVRLTCLQLFCVYLVVSSLFACACAINNLKITHKTITIFGESRFFAVSSSRSWLSVNCKNMCDVLSQYSTYTNHTNQPTIDRSYWTEYWLEYNVNSVRSFAELSNKFDLFIRLTCCVSCLFCICLREHYICFCGRVCSSCFHAIQPFQCLFYLNILVDHLYLGF